MNETLAKNKERTSPIINKRTITLKEVSYDDIREIYNAHLEIFGGPDELLYEWVEQALEYALFFWRMDTKDGKFIGTIVATMEHGSSYIWLLFIMPEFQGKGYGTHLLKKALKELRYMGYDCVFLHTKDYWEGAINFYKKFNFEIAELLRRYYRSGDNCYEMWADL